MFEPGTGEALQVPANVRTFHEIDVREDEDAALAANLYADWRDSGGAEPAYDQCIGYKKPLFLGGEDDISNQKLSDLEVYWHIMGQVIAKVNGLPPGTPVNIQNFSRTHRPCGAAVWPAGSKGVRGGCDAEAVDCRHWVYVAGRPPAQPC
ncbi:T6SS immunity protein Tdi1 domain-containing protein [Mesorhizobium sp. BHbdii]